MYEQPPAPAPEPVKISDPLATAAPSTGAGTTDVAGKASSRFAYDTLASNVSLRLKYCMAMLVMVCAEVPHNTHILHAHIDFTLRVGVHTWPPPPS